MKDDDIKMLQFVYDRMIHVHGENKNTDYMRKFNEIITKIPSLNIKCDECGSSDLYSTTWHCNNCNTSGTY